MRLAVNRINACNRIRLLERFKATVGTLEMTGAIKHARPPTGPGDKNVTEVTRILAAMELGDLPGGAQLLPLVYEELRRLAAQKLAAEKPGQTLQPTALVHEAYLRLVDVDQAQHWNSRGHFFAAAAEAMRRILIESARSKAREKPGGDWQRV